MGLGTYHAHAVKQAGAVALNSSFLNQNESVFRRHFDRRLSALRQLREAKAAGSLVCELTLRRQVGSLASFCTRALSRESA